MRAKTSWRFVEDRAFATEFFIIADLDVKTGPELAASAAKTEHAMCPRCPPV